MKKQITLFATAAVVALTFSHSANAAPQILAALEVQEGMPFYCDNGHCATDISTFCLQQDRESPRRGTAYTPASAEHFRLRLTAQDGSIREIPATNLSYTSGHGFTSVRVSLPATKLAALGAQSARLVVTRQASLIPTPVKGDPDPISPKEAEYVTKSLRPLGEEMVDGMPLATSARIVGRIATAITDYRARSTPESVDRLWNDVIDDMGPVLDQSSRGSAIKGAQREIDRCTRSGHHHSLAGVKSCLEYRHGDMMRNLNTDYWNKQPGS